MIQTKEDLHFYLEQDRKALGRTAPPHFWSRDYVYKFEIALRMHEYYANKTSGWKFTNKIMRRYYSFRHNLLGLILGFEIPINVFDAGLRINHHGLIIVNGNCRIGKFCDIHQGVNIGMQGTHQTDVPTIGDNVWIGPGAKLFGHIFIADECQIGANAVVNKSFEEKGISIAGVPAKKISNHRNPNIRRI